MSKESNSNWKHIKRQKGDCLYQAVACLKLSLPAMKLWEAFENVCLDWLIFPVLRKSLKIIKTIIKLFDKSFPQKWEIRSWDKTMNSIPLFCLYLCSLSSSTETPWTYTSFWSIKQIYLDMHWGCLSHKLKGARALAVCLCLYQIDFPPLINNWNGFGINLHRTDAYALKLVVTAMPDCPCQLWTRTRNSRIWTKK